MSAHVSRKVALILVAVGLGVGCTSSGSSTTGARWPWTKKPNLEDDAKKRHDDVLGAPPTPKHAKAGVNKPNHSQQNDASNITLRTPRIIDDREINRAAR
jgi:hypothetical protein